MGTQGPKGMMMRRGAYLKKGIMQNWLHQLTLASRMTLIAEIDEHGKHGSKKQKESIVDGNTSYGHGHCRTAVEFVFPHQHGTCYVSHKEQDDGNYDENDDDSKPTKRKR